MESVFRGHGFGALIGAARELVPGGPSLAPLHIPAGQIVMPE
jgi:hypothetical protein